MGDMADYLEEQSDGGATEFLAELKRQGDENEARRLLSRHTDNKRSQVGTTIRCAFCGKRIIKKSYQTQFCSNKGKSNCKDLYWNTVKPERMNRRW